MEKDSVIWVRTNMLDPDPDQPKKEFREKELRKLADSIKANGTVQPLIVLSKDDGRYMVIAGVKRLRAAELAGLNEVPVIVWKEEDLV